MLHGRPRLQARRTRMPRFWVLYMYIFLCESVHVSLQLCVAAPRSTVRIQIQIQIESLHTRLDEIGEMTNAASLYSRTFSQHVYDERAPRDAGGFSFALSTRQALDQGRRAPIAH